MVRGSNRIKRRDQGSPISYIESAGDLIVAACGTSVYFYNIEADLKLSKNGFIQNLESNVLSVDISGDSRYVLLLSYTKAIKNMFPPGLEPGTFRVLGERDNHYTTETC